MLYLLNLDRGKMHTHLYPWKNSDNNFSYI